MLWQNIGLLLLGALCFSHANNINRRATAVNVAFKKPVSASSLWTDANPASYAVDGDTSSTFLKGGHCGVTGSEKNPYMVIDLGDSYLINSVELWTRVKGNPLLEKRDKDMEIRVGMSPIPNDNKVCIKFDGLVPLKAVASCAKPTCGRYISVQRTTPEVDYMQVCEIMAYAIDPSPGCKPDNYKGPGTNVAFKKPVSASSLWTDANPASYAVDGDTSSTFLEGGHCGATGREKNPYMVIDLGDSYLINSVELWTRAKGNPLLEKRDKDMEIRVGMSPIPNDNEVCIKFDGLVPLTAVGSCAKPTCGRYISVQRTTPEVDNMQVCEIKAYAKNPTPGCAPDVFETPAECLLPKDPGPCDKFKKSYYFNSEKGKCKKFRYGGCEGNANLFKSKKECRNKCKGF